MDSVSRGQPVEVEEEMVDGFVEILHILKELGVWLALLITKRLTLIFHANSYIRKDIAISISLVCPLTVCPRNMKDIPRCYTDRHILSARIFPNNSSSLLGNDIRAEPPV